MANPKRKCTGFILAVISLALVFTMLFENYGSVYGVVSAYGSTYISEVQVFGGDSLDEAISNCESAGFTAVKKNINHSASGDVKDNGIYVVGYKTTDDPDKSITGISMMQMNSGYQDYTYGEVAERAVEKLGNLPTEISYAVDEFAENYENQSPAALSAADILNCYHVDELNNIKLGDYMASGDCTVDFIKKVIARSSTSAVSAICNSLVAGVADYGGENWADRLSASAVKEKLNDEDSYSRLDFRYKVVATELVTALQNFASSYNDAADRAAANADELSKTDVDIENLPDISKQSVPDVTDTEEVSEEKGDAFFIAAYELMNTYNYDGETKLGDYIVSLGNASYDSTENLRKIYPLVDSLTDGQAAMMRMCGVALTAIYLKNDEELRTETEKQTADIRKDIKEQTGSDSMSIWIGTDQTAFNQKVAVTKDAYRANSAGQIYNTLTSPDGVDTFLSETRLKIEIASGVIGLIMAVTSLAFHVINAISFTTVYTGVTISVWATCCAGIGAGAISTIFGVLGCTLVILSYVALAAMLILLIALFVKYLWDLFTDDDAEDFSEIPPVIFDEAQNKYVRYDALTMDGSPANINGENARRWNALYSTKSKVVGNPICSSQIEDLITVQYDDNTTPQGYKPVKCFGEIAAANLNANSKSDSSAVYMFCKTTENEINEGEETQQEEGTLYISKLLLSVESSETAAKAALTKSGYHVLDVNLTPVTVSIKKYTYLGYATTTNPDSAVTDIRISPRNSAAAYIFGTASYTSCGTTATGDTLYYTSYKSAGSPILADLIVKYSLDDIPEEYEPINMFCGGNAYNFNSGGTESDNTVSRTHRSLTSDHWDDDGAYVYFKPSVTYTDGEEYISGIVLVAGNVTGTIGNSADDYINALKLNKFGADLTYAAKIQLPSEVAGFVSKERWCANIATYVCYTTTHNPYRAIYGIKSYTAAPGNYNVPSNLGTVADGSYAVCDVFFELPYLVSGGSAKKYYLRGIYESHSYQFACCSGSLTGLEQQTPTTAMPPEDYEDVDWTSCGARGKGLYVLGPVEGGTPLTPDDIKVTSDATVPEGFIGVQDFKTPHRTEANNLGYRTANSKYLSSGKTETPVYIYVRQSAPVKKTYISSISVSTYTINKAVGDDLSDYTAAMQKQINASGSDYCIQTLLSQCTDEIVQANIAVEKSQTFYSNPSAVPSAASYIGVSRTTNELEAVQAIIRYVTDDDKAPSLITVGGVTYTKAGDKIPDPKGSYYLYYTTSSGTNPGLPLTGISVSGDVYEAECATALTTNSVDVAEIKSGNQVTRAAVAAKTYGDVNESNFIHMSYKSSASAMGTIYIGHGKTKKEAQCNLLSLGCNFCVDMDLNRNTGGEYVYIGYSRYKLKTTELRKGVARYAVRDIILTVGEPHRESITVNGIKYSSAVDEYTSAEDSDGTKAVSLNSGTGGKQIYLYFSTTITNDTAYPIEKLGAACSDYGMVNDDSNTWEHIYDTNGSRVNLNEGALATIDGGMHIVDSRIYLYASRTENAVKKGCEVDMNSINREFVSYDVYMKGS